MDLGAWAKWGRVVAASITVCSLMGWHGLSPVGSAPAEEGRFYTETGKTLAAEFTQFYDRYGGVLQFGYPISEARREGGYLVQWTERQRLEYHPEFAGTAHEVLLGLLGSELTVGWEGPRFKKECSKGKGECEPKGLYQIVGQEGRGSEEYFPQTGHRLGEPFLTFWRDRGGLTIYGYPISEAFRDDNGLMVQWFERARMEHHPQNAQHTVLLGHLGLESLRSAVVRRYELEVFGSPAPDTAFRIDLAQGGESVDPDFLKDVGTQARALGPGLLRLDNIYSFYDVVSRAPDGRLVMTWDKLDRALDNVRAMGREPLLCLSYMPEILSISGHSRIEQPAKMEEWAALVEATVRHVNIEKRMGVRYWEVWNEPDQIGFWRSSFPDYLRLYDATTVAALAADPSVKVGGPSTAHFSAGHLDEFLRTETATGERRRVDFVSWHEYGRSPYELGEHVKEARKIIAKYPGYNPELFVTEFNVLQGGPNDTSANGNTDKVEGAISLLASIEAMQRERLDRAFIFELKDGKGPKEYWGRWGIMTHGGLLKPIYHTLLVYTSRPSGMLPVNMREGIADGSLGMMAYGSARRSSMFVWYTGTTQARVKIKLPAQFADTQYTATLFDAKNNNPAMSGNSQISTLGARDAGDLLFTLEPNSLVIIETRNE